MNGRTPSAPAPAPQFPVNQVPPAPSLGVPQPTVAVAAAAPLQVQPAAVQAFSLVAPDDPVLPEFGPEVPERPDEGIGLIQPVRVASLSYADERIATATAAFKALDRSQMTPADIVASWKRANAAAAGDETTQYVAAGTFADRRQAEALAAKLSLFGKATVEADADSYSVVLSADGRNDIDRLAELAWENGAPDAFIVGH
jgi:rare lipoprotein A